MTSALFEIPINVGRMRKWVSGIDRTTTCGDIIRALIPEIQEDARKMNLNPVRYSDYVLVERWKDVEKSLPADEAILNIWHRWGLEKKEVVFSLKKVKPPFISRNSKTRNILKEDQHASPNAEGVIHLGDADVETRNLLRIVIAQGEVIKKQLEKLQERQNEIDKFEEKQHRMRQKQDGANYLIAACLGEGEMSNDSGIVSDKPDNVTCSVFEEPGEIALRHATDALYSTVKKKCSATEKRTNELASSSLKRNIHSLPHDKIKEGNSMLEKLSHVYCQLEDHERLLSTLTSEIMRMQVNCSQFNKICLGPQHAFFPEVPKSAVDLQLELTCTKAEMEKSVAVSATLLLEANKVQTQLKEAKCVLVEKQLYAEELEREIESTESAILNSNDAGRYEICHESGGGRNCSKAVAICEGKRILRDEDSNSDTGLSSLHSSGSEEIPFCLDTLV